MKRHWKESLLLLALIQIPLYSPTSYANNNCERALDKVQQVIEKNGSKVDSIKFEENSQSPYKQNKEAFFILGGSYYSQIINQKARSILSSPVLMRDLARDIVDSCEPITRVTFSLNNSGWFESFSYHKSIGVTKDNCIETCAGCSNPEPKWGEQYCGL